VPANDLKGLIAWLKGESGKVTVGNAGKASITHVAGLCSRPPPTRNSSSCRIAHRPGHEDLVAGQIDMMISDPITAMPQARAGTIKVYAIASDSRQSHAPGVPTVDEAGLPGYHISLWHGFWMPKGTPKPIIARLNAAVVDALADPPTRAKLAEAGQEIFPREQQTPRRCMRCKRPTSRNGGLSSRPATSGGIVRFVIVMAMEVAMKCLARLFLQLMALAAALASPLLARALKPILASGAHHRRLSRRRPAGHHGAA